MTHHLSRARRARSVGASLLELLVVSALASSLILAAVPSVQTWSSGVRVRLAAGELAAALYQARLHAIRYQANVAVRFGTDDQGAVTLTLYLDGDGDGVLSSDIRRGRDVVHRPPRRLVVLDRRVRLGFPDGRAPRHPGSPRRRVTRLSDPIKFNRSDMASFDRLGTATPGTVYLTDGAHHLAAVRVDHRSGKVSILTYDRQRETWSEIG